MSLIHVDVASFASGCGGSSQVSSQLPNIGREGASPWLCGYRKSTFCPEYRQSQPQREG